MMQFYASIDFVVDSNLKKDEDGHKTVRETNLKAVRSLLVATHHQQNAEISGDADGVPPLLPDIEGREGRHLGFHYRQCPHSRSGTGLRRPFMRSKYREEGGAHMQSRHCGAATNSRSILPPHEQLGAEIVDVHLNNAASSARIGR